MTLFRDNIAEIDKMAALAAKSGAESLKINPVMPTGRGVNIFSEGRNIPTDELIRIERRVEEELAPKYEPLDIYFEPSRRPAVSRRGSSKNRSANATSSTSSASSPTGRSPSAASARRRRN